MNKRLFPALAIATAAVMPIASPSGVPSASAVSCTVTSVLRQGSIGPAVLCLEQRLAEIGYNVGTPDVSFGSLTTGAVQAFQRSRALYPDGVTHSLTTRELGLRGAGVPGMNPVRVALIGDSTMAAMRWYDEENNVTSHYDVIGNSYDLILSAESCRRLINPSCVGRIDPSTGFRWVPQSTLPLMRGDLRGQMGQALVVMAGYDDTSIVSAIDQIMVEANLQGIARVFWMNYRTSTTYGYGPYYTAHNNALASAKVRYPNLTVLDWNGYTRAQPAATQGAWFWTDNIHLKPAGADAAARFIKAALDGAGLAGCLGSTANAGVPDPGTGTPATPGTGDTGFVPVDPARVLDTRDPGRGGGNGKLGAGHTITVGLDGVLPSGARAAVVNVTAAGSCRAGYLTVFACGTRPATSNLNFVAGRTTAGLAVSLLTDRSVCVYASAPTDVVVDVVGAFTRSGALFHPTGPTRWVDTRGNPAEIAITGALPAGSQIDVAVAGRGAVPAGARAAWLNLTAAGAQASTVLVAYPGPCGTPPPTSTVNVLTGRSGASATLVGLGSNGGVCVRTVAGVSHVVVDLAGWFGGPAEGGLAFDGSVPMRVLDTRSGAQPGAGSVTAVPTPDAAVYNIAAVTSAGFGYVQAKPCGSTSTSSLLNTAPLEPVANVASVAPGDGGAVCLVPSVASHLVADRAGVFVPPASA